MLVLTIQSKEVVQKLKDGRYTASIWESRLGCLSPRFTIGYKKMSKQVFMKTRKSCDIPVFAWGGTPFIDQTMKWGNNQIIFLDVPSRFLVYSDYDRFCDYVQKETNLDDFMLTDKVAKYRIDNGYCVQVCMPYIEKSWVLGSFDAKMLDGYDGTVSDFYRYCMLLNTYFSISSKYNVK